ncbi:MAG: ketoacyl-ACP synthase III, partial [Gammaproteobacteria bacterium]|nr:ketoacyl-ACP synthase III [Gammaproteobacteria bacterium]
MLGIKEIASYLPETKVSNYNKKNKFELDDDFIENKLGVKYQALKEKTEKASDLCVKAFENLTNKFNFQKEDI